MGDTFLFWDARGHTRLREVEEGCAAVSRGGVCCWRVGLAHGVQNTGWGDCVYGGGGTRVSPLKVARPSRGTWRFGREIGAPGRQLGVGDRSWWQWAVSWMGLVGYGGLWS